MGSSDSRSIYVGSYRIRKPFEWLGLLGALYVVSYVSLLVFGASFVPSDPLASYLFGGHVLDFPLGWLYVVSVAFVALSVIHYLSSRRA